jgi:hypothetical protein
MKIFGILTALLVLSIALFAGTAYAAQSGGSTSTTTTICQPTPNPFVVTGTSWGTSGSPLSVGPGSQDAPLTVTLLYTGPCTATAASFELSPSQPLVGTNGAASLTDYQVNLATDSIISETYYLNIGANASLGTYTIPLRIGYNTSDWLGLFFQTVAANVALKGTVNLSFTSNSSYLVAGAINDVNVSISNVGSGNASLVSPAASPTGQASVLNQLSQITELSPNSTATQTLQVFVPSSLLGSVTSIAFSASYYDSYSISRTTAQTLGFFVTSAEVATPFQVTGASWGSADVSPQPADQNVPLVVTLQYLGASSVNSPKGTLELPSGFTGTGGASSATAYTSTLSPGQAVQLTFYINIARSVTSGGQTVLLQLGWSTSSASGLAENATFSLPSITQRGSQFLIETSSWGAADSLPQPGDRNVPLVLTLQYLATSAVTSLQVTSTLPAGFTNQNGGSSYTTYSGTLSPFQTVQLTFYVDIASSQAPGSYQFPLTLTWSTTFASGLNQSLTASPPAIGLSASSEVLSMSQMSDSVVAGTLSTVSFEVRNAGTGTIYSPTFSLSTSSPLVVMRISSSPESSLGPGQTETLTAVVSASPSATPGVYGGEFSVSFADQSGAQHTQSFSAGLVLSGTVRLVVQDEVVSQTVTSLTVSGSLLNEGGTSAYYAQVTGSVQGSRNSNATAYYAGEIDPNTPVSFTITIPLSAPSSARTAVVLLGVEYKDSFGSSQTFATTSQASLESLQQLSASATSTPTQTSSGGDLVTLVSIGVVVAIAVVAVVGAIMVRRRRAAMNPDRDRKEQEVI